ncbi:MAG: hypothetical protein ABII06_07765 [Pseudomonadota bacterium]
MTKKEFSIIRGHLGKTQAQMAHLLGVSLKAIQSFEQGFRKVPRACGKTVFVSPRAHQTPQDSPQDALLADQGVFSSNQEKMPGLGIPGWASLLVY